MGTCRISLTLFLDTSVSVCAGVWWRRLASRNVPGAFPSCPSPERDKGGWAPDYGRQPPDKAWRCRWVCVSAYVCWCVCSAGLWPSVLQRTGRKCEATGPRKRMPSPATGVAKGLQRADVSQRRRGLNPRCSKRQTVLFWLASRRSMADFVLLPSYLKQVFTSILTQWCP